jgi:hypothetical protein
MQMQKKNYAKGSFEAAVGQVCRGRFGGLTSGQELSLRFLVAQRQLRQQSRCREKKGRRLWL